MHQQVGVIHSRTRPYQLGLPERSKEPTKIDGQTLAPAAEDSDPRIWGSHVGPFCPHWPLPEIIKDLFRGVTQVALDRWPLVYPETTEPASEGGRSGFGRDVEECVSGGDRQQHGASLVSSITARDKKYRVGFCGCYVIIYTINHYGSSVAE